MEIFSFSFGYKTQFCLIFLGNASKQNLEAVGAKKTPNNNNI